LSGTFPIIEALTTDMLWGMWINPEPVMVCYRFPSFVDFCALYNSPIREVHFMGELDDPDAVTFLNRLSKDSPKEGFKVVQLDFGRGEEKR